MRYGVLADIHGNLHALEAVLAALHREDVDRYLVAGDLVGYGPFPNECVKRVQGLDPVCIAGNHDLIALDRLSDRRCIRLARETLRWTRSVLTSEARTYLENLPLRAEVDGVVLAHGSLGDPEAYVTHPEDAARQLAELPGARILIVGHTHRAWACDRRPRVLRFSDGKPLWIGDHACLLNPGSVGQSRELRARARFMVLDTARSEATFHAIRYDVSLCRRALLRHGLPVEACHLRPSPARRLRRTLRRLGRWRRTTAEPTRPRYVLD